MKPPTCCRRNNPAGRCFRPFFGEHNRFSRKTGVFLHQNAYFVDQTGFVLHNRQKYVLLTKESIMALKSKIKSAAVATFFGLSPTAQTMAANIGTTDNSQPATEKTTFVDGSENSVNGRTADFAAYAAPMRNIQYYNSKRVLEGSTGGAAFNPGNNLIYNTRGTEETKTDQWLEIVHEAKHRDNQAAGARAQDMSPTEYYKIQCHDEISALLAECLAVREGYKQAADKDAYLKQIGNTANGSAVSYYLDRLQDKTFVPGSGQSVAEFDAEMTYLVNKTRQTWLKTSQQEYVDSHCSSAETHCFIKGVSGKSNPDNYRSGISKMYTFAGVDLSKYLMDEDIPLPPRAADRLSQIKVDPSTQTETFSKMYCTKTNSVQNNRNFESTPETMAIVDLSAQSNLLAQEREMLKNNPENKKRMEKTAALNRELAQQLQNENITYTAGTMAKTAAYLEQRHDLIGYQAEEYAEKLCRKYGDRAPALLAAAEAHPAAVMLNHSKINDPAKKFSAKDAAIWLADGSNLSLREADVLTTNYEKAYQAVGRGIGALTDEGRSLNDGSGLTSNFYNNHAKLRQAEQAAYTAATYLDEESDYAYLTSVLKTPDNHPEFWSTASGPNNKEISNLLFNGSMTAEKFDAYKTDYQTCKPVQKIVLQAALGENKTADAKDKISLREVNTLVRHLVDNYGAENAQKIAAAMCAAPKDFGEKSLSKLIHNESRKSKESNDDFQKRVQKQTGKCHRKIAEYAAKNNLTKQQTGLQAAINTKIADSHSYG